MAHVHCALGIAECLLFVTTLSVRFSGWIPAGPVTECLSGLDKITNCLIRRSRGNPISKSGHFGLALCRAAELLSPFCISMMLCVLGWIRGTCLRVRKPLGLHQPPDLNEHDWLWYNSLRSQDNTRGLVRLFVIQLSQALQLRQYPHACLLVLLHNSV